MEIRELRERINLWIYDSKPRVLRLLSALNALISLMSIGVVIYYYGFPLTDADKQFTFHLFQISFGFYVFRYLIRLFYDFDPVQFIKSNWIEGVVIFLLLLEGIAYNLFGTLLIEPVFNSLGFKNFSDFSTIFVQLFVFAILIINLTKQRRFNPWMSIHPGWLFTISIAGMTFIGALLLMLPEMTTTPGSLGFTDSFFTSMSSVSVTGLSTIDIPSTFTFKGQMVIMILMKLGGLNTIAFGAIMLVVAKFGVGIKYHEVIEDFLNKDSITKANSMLLKIVLWATTIEIIGCILLFLSFGNQGIFSDNSTRLFHSVFHSIAAFNNAGLSILPGGMMNDHVINNDFVHAIVLGLFFLGGFGMIYVFDLFEIKKLRERMIHPWKTIEFGTKVSLYFTLGLLIVGALVFYVFEYHNSMSHRSVLSDVLTAFYQSMTTRNAGFNLVDTASLTVPVMVIFLFLMFVGASSGSAGGGIRTSTFAIMWASVISVLRGKKHTELFKRTIANDVVLKAYAVFLFFILGNIIGPLILTVTEADLLATGRFDFMDLVFEHVSAASTVGLSTGVTTELSEAGKYVLIFAMFIGRVGTLTVAYLISKRVISSNYKYPEGHTMVG
jgi:trk system potassium uptake protein